MLEVFMILRVLSRIGLEQDQKLIRGRWGEREQKGKTWIFTENNMPPLFDKKSKFINRANNNVKFKLKFGAAEWM
jgi:hypothetical protein